MNKHLIIIPGIGDDHPIYHVAAGWWRLWGFTPHIHVFGWDSADPQSYGRRLDDLADRVRNLDGTVSVIGVSAGGAAAVAATRLVPVRRIVTLCSPLRPFDHKVNPLLEVAIDDAGSALRSMERADRETVLSIHGVWDSVVPTPLSRPEGITSRTIPTFLHVAGISLGLTLLHLPAYLFLRRS